MRYFQYLISKLFSLHIEKTVKNVKKLEKCQKKKMCNVLDPKRKIQTISEVRKEEDFAFFKDVNEIVKSLFNITKENSKSTIENIVNFLFENQNYLDFIVGVLSYYFTVRVKQRNIICELVSALFEKLSEDSINSLKTLLKYDNKVYELLNGGGVIKDESVNTENYNNLLTIYQKDSLESIIMNDDIEKFQDFVSSHQSFDFKQKIDITSTPIYNVEYTKTVSLLQFAAFYGSAQCFKYLFLLFDCIVTKSICKYAVAGGSTDIIQIIEQQGIQFVNCLETGIKYHRYELCDYLLSKYQCEEVSLHECNLCYNIEAFLFFLTNCFAPDELDNDKCTPLHIACGCGNFPIVKFLIEKKDINVEVKDGWGRTPLHLAAYRGSIEPVKYLVENCHANIDAQNGKGKTPLHLASSRARADIIKYLLEKGANKTIQDSAGKTAFDVAASFYGNKEEIKTLFD